MGILDDTFYPDNKRRAHRVAELASDCLAFSFALQKDKEEIDVLLKSATKAILDVYSRLAHKPIPFVIGEVVPLSGWWVRVPVMLVSGLFLLRKQAGNKLGLKMMSGLQGAWLWWKGGPEALLHASRNTLAVAEGALREVSEKWEVINQENRVALRDFHALSAKARKAAADGVEGEVIAAADAEAEAVLKLRQLSKEVPRVAMAKKSAEEAVVLAKSQVEAVLITTRGVSENFPSWLSALKKGGREVITLAAILLALEASISAIEGYHVRAQLQEKIHQLIPLRATLRRSGLINERIKLSLSTITESFAVVLELKKDLPKEEIDKLLENLLTKHAVQIDDITEDYVVENLEALDRERQSWTHEDGVCEMPPLKEQDYRAPVWRDELEGDDSIQATELVRRGSTARVSLSGSPFTLFASPVDEARVEQLECTLS